MRYWAAVLLFAGTAAFAQPAETPVPEPPGFRGPPYDGAVPDRLTGARVIGPQEALDLWTAGAHFIDVYPRIIRPEGLPEGTLWRAPIHQTIPGATWLYDTGHERLSAAEAARLSDGLAHVTGGDRDAPVVVFCRPDCWMGWNAAKRAVALGYRNVHWFPGGTDDWLMVGGDLVGVGADDGL